LFVEQVLAGLLVLLTGGLVFYPQLLQTYHAHVDAKDYLEQIVTGGFLLGAAYLAGMVYDRVADTLLQDLESHCRLRFAVGRVKEEINKEGKPEDPFEDGKYRIRVLGNESATAQMEYHRSRIRLMRTLAVALPGLTMALLLALDGGRTSRWWGFFALTIPFVYLAILILKLIQRWTMFERPPKTYQTQALRAYYVDRARLLPERRDRKTRFTWVLFYDEVWIGLALLFTFSSLMAVSTRSWGRLWIPFTGLVLTLLTGWVWWRISLTFYAFLRDFNKHGVCEPAAK
jgi:hypothetical protein